jgi:uncharacterized protein YmfQ (DUF2313 family)
VNADAGAKANLFLPELPDSDHSWTVTRAEIDARGFDLKAVNPHAKSVEDKRTPEELLDIIEAKGKEVAVAIAELRALTAKARAEDAAARLAGSSGAP